MSNGQYAGLLILISLYGCGTMYVVASWGKRIIAAINRS